MAIMNKNSANNMNCSLCTKLIKILKHKPENKTQLKCDECDVDNDPVVALCIECELYLCQDCNKVHSKKNRTHDIVSLSSILPTEEVVYCPEHQKNELDYYCKTCDKIVCLYCTVKDHVGHTHDIVEKTASEHRNMLMKIIAPVEQMSENLCKAEANIVSTQEKIKEQASEIDKEIDKCYTEQLKELNEHHKDLKKQLRDAVSRKEMALAEQQKEMKSIQDKLTNMKELHKNLQKSLDHEILSTKKEDIESRMQKVSDLYRYLNILPVELDTMMFDPFTQPLIKLGHLYTDTNNSEILGSPPKHCFQHSCTEFCILAKDGKVAIALKEVVRSVYS